MTVCEISRISFSGGEKVPDLCGQERKQIAWFSARIVISLFVPPGTGFIILQCGVRLYRDRQDHVIESLR